MKIDTAGRAQTMAQLVLLGGNDPQGFSRTPPSRYCSNKSMAAVQRQRNTRNNTPLRLPNTHLLRRGSSHERWGKPRTTLGLRKIQNFVPLPQLQSYPTFELYVCLSVYLSGCPPICPSVSLFCLSGCLCLQYFCFGLFI